MAHEYDAAEVDRQFDYGLKRDASSSGKTRRAASIIFDAKKRHGYGSSQDFTKKAFRFVAVEDLQCKAPDFMIDGLIEVDTLGMLFGEPGCGKSFLAIDMALCIASGTPFHERPVKQGPVIFIAGEGHNGLARRFQAWSDSRGIPLTGIPLYKSERSAEFLNSSSVTAVAQAVDQLASMCGSPSLIIVDTVARNFGPGDENSTSDMGNFIAAIDNLKARYPGAVILLVHHSGHADKQRARGAIALKAALDYEFRVQKAEEVISLYCTKIKDAEEPAPMHFRLSPVTLKNMTVSAVLESVQNTEKKTRLTPIQKLGVTTYSMAAAKDGTWDGPNFQGVNIEKWRQCFYAKHTGDTTDAKRKAFQRVRNDLLKIGLMVVNEDIYMTTDQGLLFDLSLLQQERDNQDKPGQLTFCLGKEAGSSGTDGTNA